MDTHASPSASDILFALRTHWKSSLCIILACLLLGGVVGAVTFRKTTSDSTSLQVDLHLSESLAIEALPAPDKLVNNEILQSALDASGWDIPDTQARSLLSVTTLGVESAETLPEGYVFSLLSADTLPAESEVFLSWLAETAIAALNESAGRKIPPPCDLSGLREEDHPLAALHLDIAAAEMEQAYLSWIGEQGLIDEWSDFKIAITELREAVETQKHVKAPEALLSWLDYEIKRQEILFSASDYQVSGMQGVAGLEEYAPAVIEQAKATSLLLYRLESYRYLRDLYSDATANPSTSIESEIISLTGTLEELAARTWEQAYEPASNPIQATYTLTPVTAASSSNLTKVVLVVVVAFIGGVMLAFLVSTLRVYWAHAKKQSPA